MSKKFFGYIRVSTQKQGVQGVSLQEQQDLIIRFAQHHDLEIIKLFEERETAAKRGRPIFNQMLTLVKHGKADGVIIHKVDRSARNLRDWSDIGDLIDAGIDVRVANDNLDLTSRGGRLTADIQAVMAADFIRNLREETKKGMYGRLKQGLYPLRAPIGYLDKGTGKPKEPDPIHAPIIRKAFELYATGRYNLQGLLEALDQMGLRNKRGRKITRNGLSTILNNPFYIGLIRLKTTGETFTGIHSPLILKSLFDRVQAVLRGKMNARTQKHSFLFRRMVKCANCGYSLIGSERKGKVYYRCQTRSCPTTCIREDRLEAIILEKLQPVQLGKGDMEYLRQRLAERRIQWDEKEEQERTSIELQSHQLRERLNRITDAYIDRLIEKDAFEDRKTSLLMEQKGLEEKKAALNKLAQEVPLRVNQFLGLAHSPYDAYKNIDSPEERRELIQIVTSDRMARGGNVDLKLVPPFLCVANRTENLKWVLQRDTPPTLDGLLEELIGYFSTNTISIPEWISSSTNSIIEKPGIETSKK